MPRKRKPAGLPPHPRSSTIAVRRESFPHSKYGVDAKDVPDYIEPFVAYRAWNWTESCITSLNNAPWKPKVAFEATCPRVEEHAKLFSEAQKANPDVEILGGISSLGEFDTIANLRSSHLVPNVECTCGMYAGINMQHLIDIGYIEHGLHGEVYLWGRLYRHTLGWRAQYAYPKNFVVPRNMLPFEMRQFQKNMEVLIAFDVDIYLQTERNPHVGQVNLPLWMKDYGYSQAGLDYVIQERAMWKPPQVEGLKAGDRLAILHDKGGIGIVREVTADDIYYELFGTQTYRIRQKDVRWNGRNWRWETGTLGFTTQIKFKP